MNELIESQATSEGESPPSAFGRKYDKDFESAEWKRIHQRRRKAETTRPGDNDDSQRPDQVVGLALSGGGIRSATFNLGLLQALQRWKILKQVDYLSTVSGGGYIGTCLTWFMSASGQSEFPFGTERKDHTGQGGRVLYWLRSRGSYLTPGQGLDAWALTAAILSGTLINLAILLPAILMGLFLCSLPYSSAASASTKFLDLSNIFSVMRYFGMIVAACFVLFSLWSALPLNRFVNFRSFNSQRKAHVTAGRILKASVLLVALGSLPLVHNWVEIIIYRSSAISGFAGAVSVWLSTLGKKESSKKITNLLAAVGLALIVVGLFLLLYDAVDIWNWVHGPSLMLRWYGAALVVALILAMSLNINHVSMHRFYRNCLMEAFMPVHGVVQPEDSAAEDVSAQWVRADRCYLNSIPQTGAPYHIINATVNTTGSDQAKLKGRGGDNFIFSPEFCGSEVTGYACTSEYERGRANLATAMAISGAAVDPNTYATRSRPLSFLMTMLNVRLGYWIGNPRYRTAPLMFASWHVYMYRELFGSGLNEKHWQIHLSDGGHFENLGLYELIRRKCPYIIVSDCGTDGSLTFADLAKAIEMVRVDFGAKIEIDTSPISVKDETGAHKHACTLGTIEYEDGTCGQLLYIKPVMLKDIPEDVWGYRRKHKEFPHESTVDQVFDEPQFEAYRELGYHVGKCVLARASESGDGDGNLMKLFAAPAPTSHLLQPV